MSELETTAEDVLSAFARTDRARAAYADWVRDPRRAEVVPVVTAHRTRTLYTLTPAQVRKACENTEHALEEVRRSDANRVIRIRDWHPAFAFTHVLHHCLEELGQVPTYQAFRDFARADPVARTALWEPAQEEIRKAAREHRPHAGDAMRWRIGNAYYSFLREIFVIVHCRAAGLDVRFHPLADALFRVDAWCGRTVLSLFIGNKDFRDEDSGRKLRPERLLAGGTPPFRFASVQLPAATRFGVVHLPDPDEVAAIAEHLRRSPGPDTPAGARTEAP